MKIAFSMPALDPPEDRSITTLYIGNVPTCVTDKELRLVFDYELFIVDSNHFITSASGHEIFLGFVNKFVKVENRTSRKE